MKEITIIIHTVNSAFNGCPEAEIARILTDLARNIKEGNLRDINGNAVGKVTIRK